jgi:hypothetical protein
MAIEVNRRYLNSLLRISAQPVPKPSDDKSLNDCNTLNRSPLRKHKNNHDNYT